VGNPFSREPAWEGEKNELTETLSNKYNLYLQIRIVLSIFDASAQMLHRLNNNTSATTKKQKEKRFKEEKT
jgi:hypothetical protein